MDTSALLLMRAKLPAWLGPFFSAVTVGGSASLLLPYHGEKVRRF